MFPYYLAIGMPSDEYWHGDPMLVKAYNKAHLLKRKQINQELWLQGLYIYDAFGAVLSNVFGKKGSKKAKYLEEPLSITEKTEEEKADEEKKARQKLIAQLNGWKSRWDRVQKKKE